MSTSAARSIASRGFAIALAILFATLAGCAGDANPKPSLASQSTYVPYRSIESLTNAADLIVSGTIGTVLGRFVDRGGDPEVLNDGTKTVGRPMMLVRMGISETLKGELRANAIVIAVPDSAKIAVEAFTPFREGQNVLLFLDRLTAKGFRGENLESLLPPGDSDFFVQLSADNGVFDMKGTTITARSAIVLAKTDAEARQVPLRSYENRNDPLPLFSLDIDTMRDLARR